MTMTKYATYICIAMIALHVTTAFSQDRKPSSLEETTEAKPFPPIQTQDSDRISYGELFVRVRGLSDAVASANVPKALTSPEELNRKTRPLHRDEIEYIVEYCIGNSKKFEDLTHDTAFTYEKICFEIILNNFDIYKRGNEDRDRTVNEIKEIFSARLKYYESKLVLKNGKDKDGEKVKEDWMDILRREISNTQAAPDLRELLYGQEGRVAIVAHHKEEIKKDVFFDVLKYVLEE